MDSRPVLARLGVAGVLLIVAVVVATAWTVDEVGPGLVLAAAVTAAATAGALALPPLRRGRWRQTWSGIAVVFLAWTSVVAPATATLTVSLYIAVFVFVGLTARPLMATAMVPVGVVGAVLALPPSQLVVRGGLAVGLMVVVSQLPARLLSALAARRTEVAAQHEAAMVAERALAASVERFGRVFDDSPVGMSLSDGEGRVVEVNNAAAAVVGRSRTELLGQDASLWTHPEDLHRYDGLEERMDAAPGGVVDLELRFVRPDRSVRWAWLTLAPIAGPEGERWTLAHVVDVTARREAELRAERLQQVSTSLADIARLAQQAVDPRPGIVEAVARLSGADSVALVEAAPDDEHHLVVTRSHGTDTTGVRLDLRELSVTAEVWRSGTPVDVPDLRSEARVNPALAELVSARAGIWQPVSVEGRCLGVLIGTWVEARSLTDEQVREELALLATEAGAALHAEELRRDLETSTLTDPLTDLSNRRGWNQRLPVLVQEAHAAAAPLVVGMIDLDEFKAYNDRLGHQGGDDLLVAFATVLRASLRRDDLVSRWGGDEFAIAMPGCDLGVATTVLERVRAAMPEGQRCSIGLARLADGEDPSRLVRRADDALLAAKAAGRDRIATG